MANDSSLDYTKTYWGPVEAGKQISIWINMIQGNSLLRRSKVTKVFEEEIKPINLSKKNINEPLKIPKHEDKPQAGKPKITPIKQKKSQSNNKTIQKKQSSKNASKENKEKSVVFDSSKVKSTTSQKKPPIKNTKQTTKKPLSTLKKSIQKQSTTKPTGSEIKQKKVVNKTTQTKKSQPVQALKSVSQKTTTPSKQTIKGKATNLPPVANKQTTTAPKQPIKKPIAAKTTVKQTQAKAPVIDQPKTLPPKKSQPVQASKPVLPKATPLKQNIKPVVIQKPIISTPPPAKQKQPALKKTIKEAPIKLEKPKTRHPSFGTITKKRKKTPYISHRDPNEKHVKHIPTSVFNELKGKLTGAGGNTKALLKENRKFKPRETPPKPKESKKTYPFGRQLRKVNHIETRNLNEKPTKTKHKRVKVLPTINNVNKK